MNLPTILRPFTRASKLHALAAFALAAVFVLSAASLLLAPASERAGAQEESGGSACAGVDVYDHQDLTQVAEGARRGTTFCVHDGSYEISAPVRVDDGDKFIGLYSDSSRPAVVTTNAEQVFNAGPSDGALIQGLRISGAVGGNHCEPECGRGIRGGEDLTVRNARIMNNANAGIGGMGPGLLVEDSRIDHNGSYSFARDGQGPVTAAGIKSMEPMTVLNSRIEDNYWNGVWCDGNCGAFTVKGSTITGNGKAGINDEISSGPAVFSGNTIQGNGTLAGANRPSGLLIVASSNVDAHDNTFGNNSEHGVHVVDDGRRPGVANVEVRDNTINSDTLRGCDLPRVSCHNNN